MTIFTDFCALVSTELNLGTEHDAAIPGKVKQAVKQFERKLDFPYMRRKLTTAVSEGDTSVSITTLLGALDLNQLKRIRYVALPLSSGKTVFLDKVDRIDVDIVDDLSTNPTGYWLEGMGTIMFDRELAEDATLEVGIVLYTNLTNLAANATTTDSTEDEISYHWLMKNAERALMLQSLINLGDTIREPELMIMWKNQLYGAGEPPAEAGSEWDLLAQFVEEWDQSNMAITMNPFRSKGSV